MLIIVVPILLVLILLSIAIGIFLWVRSRKKGDEEETVIGTIREDADLHLGPVAKTDVAISVTEAHASLGKGSRKVSYEDLYGVPAPQKEEGMTTRELRDYISSRIKELESNEE